MAAAVTKLQPDSVLRKPAAATTDIAATIATATADVAPDAAPGPAVGRRLVGVGGPAPPPSHDVTRDQAAWNIVELVDVDDPGARQHAGQAITGGPRAHEDHACGAAGHGRHPQEAIGRDVAGDDDERRGAGFGAQGVEGGVADVGAGGARGQREAVEDVVAPGRTVLADHDVAVEPHGDRLPVQQRGHAERGGDLDRQVELALGAVGVDLGVDDDGDVRPAVVDVVADHQLARPRRRHPVDVAVVVAELVLAQGVEGDVAGRRGVRRRALEVLGEADRQRAERGDARVHPQGLHVGLGDLPPHQVEQVALDDERRADLDDAAAVGRQRVHGLGRPAGPERRDVEAHRAAGDVLLDRARRDRRPARVRDAHDGDGAVADGDALGLQRPLDVELEAPDHERQGDRQHEQASGGDDHQLDPAEHPPADVGDDREDGDGPAARRQRDRSAASCALAHRGGELDAVEELVDEHAWSRPGRARPPASAACGGPSRPARRRGRRRG